MGKQGLYRNKICLYYYRVKARSTSDKHRPRHSTFCKPPLGAKEREIGMLDFGQGVISHSTVGNCIEREGNTFEILFVYNNCATRFSLFFMNLK